MGWKKRTTHSRAVSHTKAERNHSRETCSREPARSVGSFPVVWRERDLPEIGRRRGEFDWKQVALGALPGCAHDACFGSLPCSLVPDLHRCARSENARRQNHGSMDVHCDCVHRNLDGLVAFGSLESKRNANNHSVASAPFFGVHNGGSIRSVRRLDSRLDHRSSPQNPICGLMSSIPNSQPSARSTPHQTTLAGLDVLLTRFVSSISCLTSRFWARTSKHP